MTTPEGMPCWAPGAAEYLASILTGREVALEWGGGASTVWLAPKVHQVTVVEHDPKWRDFIWKNRTSVNIHFVLVDYQHDHYIHPEWSTYIPKTHLYLIDGFRRIDCLKVVEDRAQKGDIVVLDDALDYGEHLLDGPWEIKRFAQPHPHAGIPMVSSKHKLWRNSVRTHHPLNKETWVATV